MKVDYFKSALLHHSKGNWNKAREIYEHILKTNPNNYSVLQNYGPLLSQLKEFALAKNVFEKSLKLNPKDPLLLYNYAKFYHDQKIFDKACIDKTEKLTNFSGILREVCKFNLKENSPSDQILRRGGRGISIKRQNARFKRRTSFRSLKNAYFFKLICK